MLGIKECYFLINKTTIEVIEEKDANPSVDKLWDWHGPLKLNQTHTRLKKAGVDISEINPRLKRIQKW